MAKIKVVEMDNKTHVKLTQVLIFEILDENGGSMDAKPLLKELKKRYKKKTGMNLP